MYKCQCLYCFFLKSRRKRFKSQSYECAILSVLQKNKNGFVKCNKTELTVSIRPSYLFRWQIRKKTKMVWIFVKTIWIFIIKWLYLIWRWNHHPAHSLISWLFNSKFSKFYFKLKTKKTKIVLIFVKMIWIVIIKWLNLIWRWNHHPIHSLIS